MQENLQTVRCFRKPVNSATPDDINDFVSWQYRNDSGVIRVGRSVGIFELERIFRLADPRK
jgi:hypothetical protein